MTTPDPNIPAPASAAKPKRTPKEVVADGRVIDPKTAVKPAAAEVVPPPEAPAPAEAPAAPAPAPETKPGKALGKK